VHDAQPDRCHLSIITVKMILVTYKLDVHRADARSPGNVAGRRQARGHSPPVQGRLAAADVCSRPLAGVNVPPAG